MKRMIMTGLVAIAGAMLATASMAHQADVDVLMMDLQPDVGVYELALVPDGAGFLVTPDVLASADVVSDTPSASEVATFLMVSLTEPMATPGGASTLMTSDPLLGWRSRDAGGFAVAPIF